MCQNAFVNSLDDFCFFAPSKPGSNIGDTEEEEVSFCLKSGYGTRTVPQDVFTGAHYLVTPHYTQITAIGDFTKVNVKAADEGGELDPHGATEAGNPIGGLVYAKGQQVFEWHQFISATELSLRVCTSSDAEANKKWCPHIYDEMGSRWNDPGSFEPGFTSCEGDGSPLPSGIYYQGPIKKTYHQGDQYTPRAPLSGAFRNCRTFSSLRGMGETAGTRSSSGSSGPLQGSSLVNGRGELSNINGSDGIQSNELTTTTSKTGPNQMPGALQRAGPRSLAGVIGAGNQTSNGEGGDGDDTVTGSLTRSASTSQDHAGTVVNWTSDIRNVTATRSAMGASKNNGARHHFAPEAAAWVYFVGMLGWHQLV
ncbi:BQ2448_7275 [Microbotryum intermedium]|uniref:BQ2448_7275 protein n=1 Tax=Microbotryum intermedium TaxID=269621 RepID=A0A238FKM5_9BASI|nr:BQ2448_7275 [Microbotryum intermedium]